MDRDQVRNSRVVVCLCRAQITVFQYLTSVLLRPISRSFKGRGPPSHDNPFPPCRKIIFYHSFVLLDPESRREGLTEGVVLECLGPPTAGVSAGNSTYYGTGQMFHSPSSTLHSPKQVSVCSSLSTRPGGHVGKRG